MKHIGLFEGIGGFSLAARWMGWQTIAMSEIDPFCQRVLSYHFPNATIHGDIKQTDFTIYRGQCDILTGGFPCQPYSISGKRLGKDDDRHLWPWMLEAIKQVQPRWVVGENVRGLTNWQSGLVFHEVQADLEAAGYEVFPLLLPAAGVGAPHERYRIWFVAYASSAGRGQFNVASKPVQKEHVAGLCDSRVDTHTIEQRLWREGDRAGRSELSDENGPGGYWAGFPAQSPVCHGDDGLSARLDAITFSKWRRQSIKAGGNAIVPQVAYEIYKAIQAYDNQNQ